LTCLYIVSCYSFFDLTFHSSLFPSPLLFLSLSLMVRFSLPARVRDLTFCGTWHSITPQHVFER
jgi:hypothetical protein